MIRNPAQGPGGTGAKGLTIDLKMHLYNVLSYRSHIYSDTVKCCSLSEIMSASLFPFLNG